MKIKCKYCDNYFDDIQNICPHCGAPNDGVVRTVSKQPVTIEQLKQWYNEKGLPPYETTRFFIGEDYKKPRAFGIYKDSKGKCVVYKNKDNGQRAIRYEGTDEAYAVNELYQRLKQEIIQQKAHQINKNTVQNSDKKRSRSAKKNKTEKNKPKGILGFFLDLLSIIFALFLLILDWFKVLFIGFGLILLIFIVGVPIVVIADPPYDGYYQYEDDIYYCIDDAWFVRRDWIEYDDDAGKWSEQRISKDVLPSDFKKNTTAQEYFISKDWTEELNATDAKLSTYYLDLVNNKKVDIGYYQYDDSIYYHVKDKNDSGWYAFTGSYGEDTEESIGSSWESVSAEQVPEELKHSSAVNDFYYTPTWDSSTQLTDFLESDAYSAYVESQEKSYSSSSSSSFWDDDDDDFDWDWGSSWDSGSSDWDSDW